MTSIQLRRDHSSIHFRPSTHGTFARLRSTPHRFTELRSRPQFRYCLRCHAKSSYEQSGSTFWIQSRSSRCKSNGFHCDRFTPLVRHLVNLSMLCHQSRPNPFVLPLRTRWPVHPGCVAARRHHWYSDQVKLPPRELMILCRAWRGMLEVVEGAVVVFRDRVVPGRANRNLKI